MYSISGERYEYDETLGLYAHESHERLAKLVMAGFVYHEQAQIDVGFVENLGESGAAVSSLLDESRISSLVESHDAYMGYGLVTPRLDTSEELGGIWYRVKRDGPEPTIMNFQDISFRHPASLTTHEGLQEVEQLMFQFDKSELESILRMVGKMTKRLQANRPSRMNESDNPSSRWLRITASAQVESDVLYAIKSHSLENLSLLFSSQTADKPAVQLPGKSLKDEKPEELQHISEWSELQSVAGDLVAREADPSLAFSCVNVQYEADNKTYYMRLAAEYGKLFAIQILCDDSGGWRCQRFDLNASYDEDESEINMIASMWTDSRDNILKGLREGEIINDETYEGYRSVAEDQLLADFTQSNPVIQLDGVRNKKRPAA